MRARPVLTGLVLFSLAPPLDAGDVTLREGHPFPEIHLPALRDGKLRAVSSYRGKKTLLLVFASW